RRRASAPRRRRGGSRSVSLPRPPSRRRRESRGWAATPSARRLSREAQPGEDLATLRQVPVAESRGRDTRVGRPGAAPQDPVVLPEEDLGVLAVGVGPEAGVGQEVRGGPLPDGADAPDPIGRLLRGRRPLPLLLARKARFVRAGEGVGLEPADVADGSLRVTRCHGRMVADVVLLLPRPALVGPPLAAFVAAALAEAHPARVRDGDAGDPKGRQLDAVARALVVVCEP